MQNTYTSLREKEHGGINYPVTFYRVDINQRGMVELDYIITSYHK